MSAKKNAKKQTAKKQIAKKAVTKKTAKKASAKKAAAKKITEKINEAIHEPVASLSHDATINNHSDYDDIPYHHSCFDSTNPAQLGAIGHIFGIPTTAAENCSFLDIGCAQGFNPLIFARIFPNSQCVGMDLSVKQIEEGRALAQKFNINNLELYHHDVDDDKNDPLKGRKFDYIVCHGVFAWVPPNVQQAILKYIKSHLHKNGIAYVSYNAMPGWSRLLPMRDVMQRISQHTNHWEDKVKIAIEYLEKLSEEKHENDIIRAAKESYDRLKKLPSSYIYHEFFEEYNAPLYLSDFVDMAKQNQLSYITDIMLNTSIAKPPSKDMIEMITQQSDDRVYMEQMTDIIYNRQFKSSLLCHEEHNVKNIDFAPYLRDVHIRLNKKPKDEDKHDFKNNMITEWGYPTLGIKTESRLHAVALETIVRNYPYSINYKMIIDNINVVLRNNGKQPLDHDDDVLRIANLLSDMVTNAVVTVTQQQFKPSANNPNYPKISDFNLQLFKEMNLLVNDVGVTVAVDGGMGWIIPLCDGTRHINDIENILFNQWRDGNFIFRDSNKNPITDHETVRKAINNRITDTIKHLQEYYLI